MINMNNMMKKVLIEDERQQGKLEIGSIVNSIVRKTKIVNSCLIYDEDDSVDENEINFNNILKLSSDWTGYEVSCNEIRLNRKEFNARDLLVLAKELYYMLSQEYPQRKIIVYVSLIDSEIDLRFHTYRKDERPWLEKDLNKYNVPILCYM